MGTRAQRWVTWGLGIVKETAQRIKDFEVQSNGKNVSILEAPLAAPEGSR